MGSEAGEGQRRTTVSPRRPARNAAEASLAAHPGYRAFQAQHAFKITLDGVFWPNYRSLKSLLDQAATDRDLGIELIQNVYDDAVARQFNAEASRRLHNYVAATMSMVEHSRRLLRGRDDDVSKAWDERRADLLTNGEVPFIIDLRVFIQHRDLPVLAHSLHIGNPKQCGRDMGERSRARPRALAQVGRLEGRCSSVPDGPGRGDQAPPARGDARRPGVSSERLAAPSPAG